MTVPRLLKRAETYPDGPILFPCPGIHRVAYVGVFAYLCVSGTRGLKPPCWGNVSDSMLDGKGEVEWSLQFSTRIKILFADAIRRI